VIFKGVNTGFGGSADTRTRRIEELQRTLIRELHYGILATPPAEGSPVYARVDKTAGQEADIVALLTQEALPNDDPVAATCMPEAWVRASILVRINSLASGHSGVRPVLVKGVIDLLRRDIVPRIPLRGSISASGDLSPLSYIGGTLQGKRTLTVLVGDRSTGHRRIVTADVALAESSIDPIKLGPKEGLSIVNGTAVSTGVGALAIHDANGLAVLSQVLTAMSVEALCGTNESFDPFFAMVRPHPGQIEASQNIFSFLAGSKLVHYNDGSEAGSLRQDRYSIRTASQWLGPVLEDLLLAHKQVTIECNSVTDNPLVDTEGARTVHGGNFQARAITSAMEKTRLALQTIGRMLFAQCTELINPALNRGLPPNLVADEPSQSFLMKSVDLMIAALQSELGFLSNPVGSHVQTAEMGNQALNSLALISARYTHVALDVLSQLASAHLFALCQALDLRAMHIRFLEALEPVFRATTLETIGSIFREEEDRNSLLTALWTQLIKRLDQTTTVDSDQRFASTIGSLQPVILDFPFSPSSEIIPALKTWTARCAALTLETYNANRDHYSAHPDATPFLGPASHRMYRFVRERLSVPFLGPKSLRSPDPEPTSSGAEHVQPAGVSTAAGNETVGSLMTTIYSSVRSGALYVPVMDCLRDVTRDR